MSYRFDQNGRFVIENFSEAKPFSSFLPGIAGIKGTPLWTFYVNRGQAIASFGVEDKNGSIMEFQPAHRSYSLTPTQGFRTFLKFKHSNGQQHYVEPFSDVSKNEQEQRNMLISDNMLELQSIGLVDGLEVKVEYFTMPTEDFAALVRRVTFVNNSSDSVKLEVLDGMPALLPYGIDNVNYKELGYTLKSWMDVYNLENNIPYYKLRGSTADTAEVHHIDAGHFMYSFIERNGQSELLKPIVDSSIIFGNNFAFTFPDRFLTTDVDELLAAQQKTTNKVPGAFCGYEQELQAGESVSHCMVIGHVKDIERINKDVARISNMSYIDGKLAEAKQLTRVLTDDIATETSMPLFDAYCRQNYLDNVLRGGYPVLFDNGTEEPFVYHVFSRKHGDLERDYNFFKLLPSFYSQGNGNFRDANQNRRSDIWFNPEVGDFNIRMFMSFIQADGYNPLVVKGCSFVMQDVSPLLPLVEKSGHKMLTKLFAKPYTPGELLHNIMALELPLINCTEDEFLAKALSQSIQQFEADFAEGYWIDHWTYNMDLVDSYLSVYPDRRVQLLTGKRTYTYYDSPAWVESRRQKYVRTADGRIRQYGSIVESKEKEELIHNRREAQYWVRTEYGKGDVYYSNLYEKLLSLATLKLATLDPEGLGIEMEANKPGWNDSLNGLPGLFASGFSETCELLRIVDFLLEANEELDHNTILQLPQEMNELIGKIKAALIYEHSSQDANRRHMFWDKISTAREQYRQSVRFGFDGSEVKVTIAQLVDFLKLAKAKLQDSMKRGLEIGKGVYPTYFYYEVDAYTIEEETGVVVVNSFMRKDLPYFLEGPTRAMKVLQNSSESEQLYHSIRRSGLYDNKLGMYKVNESLVDQPFELGRTRAFTPGWLENESVFMHMEYKYLLECLRNGLYEQFFADMQKAMPPFMDPAVYGRSTLENSSFIASSANPDEELHGTGYIARLSGSTAEFVHMWTMMMTGIKPFSWKDGKLSLALQPILPAWLFTEEGQISFTLLGSCKVTYINEKKRDTFSDDVKVVGYELHYHDGSEVKVDGAVLGHEQALAVRNKHVAQMRVVLA